jgi:hypothetical protein
MPFEEAYRESISLAGKTLAVMEPGLISIRTGGRWEGNARGEGLLHLTFWAGECAIRFPEVEIEVITGPKTLKPTEQIVILHYLIHAQGVPTTGNWITFRQIPSGMFYYEPFVKRCIKPFTGLFGRHPEILREFSKGLPTLSSIGLGDISLVLRPLPNIPLAFVLWQGDDEFPAEGNILFDETIPSFLPTEDIVVLAGILTYGLLAQGRNLLESTRNFGRR